MRDTASFAGNPCRRMAVRVPIGRGESTAAREISTAQCKSAVRMTRAWYSPSLVLPKILGRAFDLPMPDRRRQVTKKHSRFDDYSSSLHETQHNARRRPSVAVCDTLRFRLLAKNRDYTQNLTGGSA